MSENFYLCSNDNCPNHNQCLRWIKRDKCMKMRAKFSTYFPEKDCNCFVNDEHILTEQFFV